MAVDWRAALAEQAEVVTRTAENVPRALADPRITREQARTIYKRVVEGSQAFEQFLELMAENCDDDDLYDAAEQLDDIWSKLVILAAERQPQK